MPGVAGVEHKYFGSFTERAFWIEMMKIDRRALWISTSEGARRLIVTLSGSATLNGLEIGRLAAIQADSGDWLYVSATEKTVLYIIGLPPGAVADYPVRPVRCDRERRRDPVRGLESGRLIGPDRRGANGNHRRVVIEASGPRRRGAPYARRGHHLQSRRSAGRGGQQWLGGDA
jgi:hypothetical protein